MLPRTRSLPYMLLAALLSLALAVTVALAEEQKDKKDEGSNGQGKSAPAATTKAPEKPAGPAAAPHRPLDNGRQTPSSSPQGSQPGRTPSEPQPNQPGRSPSGPQVNPRTPERQAPQVTPQAPNNTNWRTRNRDANPPGQPYQPSQPRQPNLPGRSAQPKQTPSAPRPVLRDNGAGDTASPTAPRSSQTGGWRQRATPSPSAPRSAGETPQAKGRVQTPERASQPTAAREHPASVRMSVPKATFRGVQPPRPAATPTKQQQVTLAARLNSQVHQWNRSTTQATPTGRLQRDVIGNPIPTDARFLRREKIERLAKSYAHVRGRLGAPTNWFAFIPRYPTDYQEGYWDGYQDGYWDGRHGHHHPAVVFSFYYSYYWSDPTWFGFYYPGYYTAVYHYYGYCPGWVYPSRVYVAEDNSAYWPSGPYRYYGGTRVDEAGAERAISDIRQAWYNNDVDLFAAHLTDQLDIQVYFDGKYEYTTSTEDYYGMTADALANTQTATLSFDEPIFVSSNEVFYTGRHEFYDPDGYRQVVYLSYRLRKLGTEWFIVSVGSSLEPVQHEYRDFRYQ